MSDFQRKFVWRHVFTDVSKMEDGANKFSEIRNYYGIPWKIGIAHNEHGLGAYLHCLVESDKEWTVQTSHIIKLIAPNGKTALRQVSKILSKSDTSWGFPAFVVWSEMKKNYLVDDKILIEIDVEIKKITGSAKSKLIEFDEKENSDVALKVGEKEFHVSKLILAAQSPYFKAMFLGKFAEAEKEQVELKDVDPIVFQDYLELIYGENALTDENVEKVLELAEMYDSPKVMNKCEDYLISTYSGTPLKKKIQISGRFKLENLRRFCMDQLKSIQDVRSVLPVDFQELDYSVVSELLRKMLELTANQ